MKKNSNEAPYTPELKVTAEYSLQLPEKVDLAFGIHVIKLDSGSYILCMDKDKLLHLENPLTNERFFTKFNNYVSGVRLYSADVADSVMYFLNEDSLILYSFRISGNGKLLETNRIHFKDRIDLKRMYVRFQSYKTFKIRYPYIYLAYGVNDPATKYLDRYAYLKINLEDTNKPIVHTGFYPDVFRDGDYDYNDTFLNFFSDGSLLYSFISYDSLYKLDQNGCSTKGIVLNENSRFKKFDKSKRGDLGYVRQRTLTNESNPSIAINNDQVFIIKRLRKTKMSDPDHYDYYLLDEHLNVKYKNTFKHTLEQFFGLPFLKGFLVFDEDLDKAFYYETF